MRLVIIESPYKGKNWEDLERNKRYLRACIRDCINRDESPYASHRLLTDALDDTNPIERAVGIKAGLAWRHARQAVLHDDSDPSIGVLRPQPSVKSDLRLELGSSTLSRLTGSN